VVDKRTLALSIAIGVVAACLVAFLGSRCTGGEANCRTYDAPRDGWLLDYEQRGEVALWSEPTQTFQDGNETTATVPYGDEGGEPVGGSIAVTVLEECTVNGILYHRVDVGELGTGWVDAVYILWEKR